MVGLVFAAEFFDWNIEQGVKERYPLRAEIELTNSGLKYRLGPGKLRVRGQGSVFRVRSPIKTYCEPQFRNRFAHWFERLWQRDPS